MLGKRKAISESWGHGRLARAKYGVKLAAEKFERERAAREAAEEAERLAAIAAAAAAAAEKARLEAEAAALYESRLVHAISYSKGVLARDKYGEMRSKVIYARAQFFGEAYSRGLVQRMKWKGEKAKLVDEGTWQVGGQSLIKKRKKAAPKASHESVCSMHEHAVSCSFHSIHTASLCHVHATLLASLSVLFHGAAKCGASLLAGEFRQASRVADGSHEVVARVGCPHRQGQKQRSANLIFGVPLPLLSPVC